MSVFTVCLPKHKQTRRATRGTIIVLYITWLHAAHNNNNATIYSTDACINVLPVVMNWPWLKALLDCGLSRSFELLTQVKRVLAH